MQEVDLVVIGRSVTSTSLTFHLANECANVILLERERGYTKNGASEGTMSNINLHNIGCQE